MEKNSLLTKKLLMNLSPPFLNLSRKKNSSGTIKLPLQVIGKSKNPRCFKSINKDLLPVKYSSQKNAWMNTAIFHDWFHLSFVPYVRDKLSSLGLEPKAVLVLDNCSAHPSEADLISDDEKITVRFLPPNVTSLIQPMDQGVLKALKLIYKKKLLRRLLIEDDRGGCVVDFLKAVDMKKVVQFVAEAWEEIKADTFRKSWRKIISLPKQEDSSQKKSGPSLQEDKSSDSVSETLSQLFELVRRDCDDQVQAESLPSPSTVTKSSGSYAIWKGIRIRPQLPTEQAIPPETPLVPSEPSIPEFQEMFAELRLNLEDEEIASWLESDFNDPGVQILSDTEICDLVNNEETSLTDSEDEEQNEEPEDKFTISNSDAAYMFEQCLIWLEHQEEANTYNTLLLRQLHSLSAGKRMNSLKQRSINTYFKTYN